MCCMLPWGVVHHKDGNRQNNNMTNLQGMSRSVYTRLHSGWLPISNEIERDRTVAVLYIFRYRMPVIVGVSPIIELPITTFDHS